MAGVSAAALAHYRQVLNVRMDADASTLKNAYREASRVSHPDHPGGSEEAFQLIGEAYSALTQHAHEQQWGTSSSAYGAGIAARPKLLEFNGRR